MVLSFVRQVVDEASKESGDLSCVMVERFEFVGCYVAEIEGNVEVALGFEGRGMRDPEEAVEFCLASAPESFGDVCHD